MHVTDAINEFIMACNADGLRATTLIWYTSLLKRFAKEHGVRLLVNITPSELRMYIVGIKSQYSENTTYAHIKALHRFWRWCANEYGIPNPMHNIRYPTQPSIKVPKAAKIDDIIAMLKACGQSRIGKRDRAMIAVMIDSGCRAGGICSLRMEAVNLEEGWIIVTEKGDRTRRRQLLDLTIEILKAWIEVRVPNAETLFHGKVGRPLQPNGLYQRMMVIKKRASVQGYANPHAFRHAYAMYYLTDGGDIVSLRDQMGHQSAETTSKHYGVFAPNELARLQRLHSPMNKIKVVLKNDPDGRF